MNTLPRIALAPLLCCAVSVLPVASTAFAQKDTMPPAARALMQAGHDAAHNGQLQAAIADYEKAREIAPQASELFFGLGIAEAKTPGRELRALLWLELYLGNNRSSPSSIIAREIIPGLWVKSGEDLGKLVDWLQLATGRRKGVKQLESFAQVAVRRAEMGDIAGAQKVLTMVPDPAAFPEEPEKQGGDRLVASGGESKTGMPLSYVGPALAARCIALGSILQAQWENGQSADAKKTLASIFKTAALITDPYRREWERADAVVTQARIGDIPGALQSLALIRDPDWSDDALKRIVLLLPADALHTAHEIFARITPAHRVEAFSGIANSRTDLARDEEVFKLINLIPDSAARNEALVALVDLRCQNGDFSGASRVAAMISSGDSDPGDHWKWRARLILAAQRAIMGNVREAGEDFDAAMQAASLVEDPLARGTMQAGIVTFEARKTTEIPEYFARHLDAALKTVEPLPGEPAALVLLQLATAQGRTGDREGAKKTVQLALKKTATLDIFEGQADAAVILAKAGDIPAALEAAKAVALSRSKDGTLATIAQVQMQQGDTDGARQTMGLIVDVPLRGKTKDMILRWQWMAQAGSQPGKTEWLADDFRPFQANSYVRDWTPELDDDSGFTAYPLHTPQFLDTQGYLGALHPEDAEKFFQPLDETVALMIRLRGEIKEMLSVTGDVPMDPLAWKKPVEWKELSARIWKERPWFFDMGSLHLTPTGSLAGMLTRFRLEKRPDQFKALGGELLHNRNPQIAMIQLMIAGSFDAGDLTPLLRRYEALLTQPGFKFDKGVIDRDYILEEVRGNLEYLTLQPEQAAMGRPWRNSLGMCFLPVDGTKSVFCITETPLYAFREFVRATHYDATGGMYSATEKGWEQWRQTGATWESMDSDYYGGNAAVVGVSWKDAGAFCKWLTKKEREQKKLDARHEYRLPTDEEWSIAVGLPHETGATPSEKNLKIKGVYAWGTQWPHPQRLWFYDNAAMKDNVQSPADEREHPANRIGLYQLGGNVWEWCEDWYDASQKERVTRGPSWQPEDPGLLLASRRDPHDPGLRHSNIGFRCVVALTPEAAAAEPPPLELPAGKVDKKYLHSYCKVVCGREVALSIQSPWDLSAEDRIPPKEGGRIVRYGYLEKIGEDDITLASNPKAGKNSVNIVSTINTAEIETLTVIRR